MHIDDVIRKQSDDHVPIRDHIKRIADEATNQVPEAVLVDDRSLQLASPQPLGRKVDAILEPNIVDDLSAGLMRW